MRSVTGLWNNFSNDGRDASHGTLLAGRIDLMRIELRTLLSANYIIWKAPSMMNP